VDIVERDLPDPSSRGIVRPQRRPQPLQPKLLGAPGVLRVDRLLDLALDVGERRLPPRLFLQRPLEPGEPGG